MPRRGPSATPSHPAQIRSATLAWGSDDTIGDPTYARHIVEGLDTIDIEIIPKTDHTAPVARPELLTARLSGEGGWRR